jgi:hypothetical protein
MADTTYTLPDVIIKGETYTIELISAIPDLTVPTQNLLISMGDRKEDMETDIPEFGSIVPEQIDLEFKDKDGFFAALLAEDFDVRIIRSPDIKEFYGHILTDEPIEQEETFVSSTTARTNVTLQCISFIDKLKSYTIEDVLTQIATHYVGYYDEHGVHNDQVLVNDLFASFLEVAFGTSNALAIPQIPNNDFKYWNETNGTLVAWDDLGICPNKTVLFNPAAENYAGKFYDNALDFLAACAASFGFIPRIYYDWPNDCTRMQLITKRRQVYTAVAAPTRFVPGKKYTKAYGVKSYKFFEKAFDSPDTYLHEAWTRPGETEYEGVAPTDYNFDTEMRILFNAGIDLTDLSGATSDTVDKIGYYDYHTLAWVATSLIPGHTSMVSLEAHLRYYKAQRDYKKEFFERTFKGFTENYISTVLVMHNGVENKNYYINSFTRSYEKKEETYDLIEV